MIKEALKLTKTLVNMPHQRADSLLSLLKKMGLSYKVFNKTSHKHIFIPGKSLDSRVPLLFVAHHDRVRNTPGANDNSASLAHLLIFLGSTAYRDSFHKPSILFSDGEEIENSQGVQGLLPLLKEELKGLLEKHLIFVFDMCGKGDTFVLSKGAQDLLEQRQQLTGEIERKLHRNRTLARKVLMKTSSTGFFEASTPFSDDLSFLMAGIPAIQISLLPYNEAKTLAKKGFHGLPSAWSSMHTFRDVPEALESGCFGLMQSLLTNTMDFPFRVALE